MNKFTHLDKDGNPRMVDVSMKNTTNRIAIAKGIVLMQKETLVDIQNKSIKKGDVLSIAQLAGIMGAKKTADIIPLCHPLNLNSVSVDLSCDMDRNAIYIKATCKISDRTGVEMEALTAVTVTALTIYDMCKSIDRSIKIVDIHLSHKSGGKSGTFNSV